MNILIAEDDEQIANSLQKYLTEEDYCVTLVPDGVCALELVGAKEFDLIILDWRMPKLSGIEVCKKLRESGVKTPIIILTALNLTSNKIEGLNEGADDYITKPFEFEELLARMKAVLRRTTQNPETITFEGLTLYLISRKLRYGQEEIRLTDKEFELLLYFLNHKGKIISREELAKAVWELSFLPSSNVIEASVKNLRKKLEEQVSKNLIKSVYREGYIFIAE